LGACPTTHGRRAPKGEGLKESVAVPPEGDTAGARSRPSEHVVRAGWGRVNISREQIRQGRRLIERRQMSDRVRIVRGDARALDFPDRSFDAIVCLEAAGDICVSEEDKERFVCELHRVLRPDGRVGFSDLALHANPPPTDNRTLRAVLYHRGEELVTDWPALFLRCGFSVPSIRTSSETMPTWQRTQAIYEERRSEVVDRYGKRIADRTRAQVHRIPAILAGYATFPVLSVLK
jgi:SAM-dependent methyltransferase